MESVPYFVYTSGEKQGRQIDWAVKFVSAGFSPSLRRREALSHEALLQLDRQYIASLTPFGLAGSLSGYRPKGQEPGFLLLPWEKGTCLLGFFYNFEDLQRRRNISLVAALISGQMKKQVTPQQAAGGLLANNDVYAIARPRLHEQEQKREFFQRLAFASTPLSFDVACLLPLAGQRWPGLNECFISAGGRTSVLSVGSLLSRLLRRMFF